MVKKLTKKNNGKVLFGVCSGFGDYFNIDPVIIRIAFLAGVFCIGGGLLVYLLSAIILPSDN